VRRGRQVDLGNHGHSASPSRSGELRIATRIESSSKFIDDEYLPPDRKICRETDVKFGEDWDAFKTKIYIGVTVFVSTTSGFDVERVNSLHMRHPVPSTPHKK
jgi:hypothetical protein